VNHLWPLTHVASRVAEDAIEMLVASLDANRSVIPRSTKRIFVEQRLQPLLLLQLRAELGEDLHCCGVGPRSSSSAERARGSAILAQRRVLEVRRPVPWLASGRRNRFRRVWGSRCGFDLQSYMDRRRKWGSPATRCAAPGRRFGRSDELVVERDELFLSCSVRALRANYTRTLIAGATDLSRR